MTVIGTLSSVNISSAILPIWLGPDQSAFEINLMPVGGFRWRYWDERRICIAESQDFWSIEDCYKSIWWVAASDNLTVSYGALSDRRISAYLVYWNYQTLSYGWRLFDQLGRMFLKSPTTYASASQCWTNIAKLQKADNKTIEGLALTVDNYSTRIEPKPVAYTVQAIVI